LPRPARLAFRVLPPVLDGVRGLQSGLVGDYVAWISVGLCVFAGGFWLLG
jgi:hypothetical protein